MCCPAPCIFIYTVPVILAFNTFSITGVILPRTRVRNTNVKPAKVRVPKYRVSIRARTRGHGRQAPIQLFIIGVG